MLGSLHHHELYLRLAHLSSPQLAFMEGIAKTPPSEGYSQLSANVTTVLSAGRQNILAKQRLLPAG